MIPIYRQMAGLTFAEVFPTAADFASEITNLGVPLSFSKEETLTTIYYLLYGKYADSHIASSNIL